MTDDAQPPIIVLVNGREITRTFAEFGKGAPRVLHGRERRIPLQPSRTRNAAVLLRFIWRVLTGG
jgi:hypothetical protein